MPRTIIAHVNIEVPDVVTTATLAEDVEAELRGVLAVGVDEDHAPFLSESEIVIALVEEV